MTLLLSFRIMPPLCFFSHQMRLWIVANGCSSFDNKKPIQIPAIASYQRRAHKTLQRYERSILRGNLPRAGRRVQSRASAGFLLRWDELQLIFL